MLATAVVTAVTTPAVLLTVTPAFAETQPTAGQSATQQAADDKPTIEELEKAAEEAQKAYDDAVAKQKAAQKAMDLAFSDQAPHAVAAKAAADEAAAAKAAKEAADQAVVDAEAELDALPETATEEERAAAEEKVASAKEAAAAAEAAKAAADEKAKTAADAADDARVAAAQALTDAQRATAEALEAKKAADKALADARAEEDDDDDGDDDDDEDPACVPATELTTVASGLPSKIVAGSTVNFSVRVTNGTDKTLDKVLPFVYFHATDKSGYNVVDEYFDLQWWSPDSSPEWTDVVDGGYAGSISPLKAGAHADVKLRLKVDAKAPAGDGVAFIAGDYVNDDDTCGGNFFTEYEFDVLAAGSKPGTVDDAKPGKTSKTKPAAVPQGGTNGTLANTGSASALPQLAAAAGAAVALGAGAVFVVRRRNADSAS
ncbi:peptidase [Streptomyces sp. NPDC015127]|uniref:peptidase n=1 Tax=Streptomyces sp. NPDC015127 TaxID=3364939 RepID=UPI0036F54CB4